MKKYIDILIVESGYIKQSYKIDYTDKRLRDLKLICNCKEFPSDKPDTILLLHRRVSSTNLVLWRGFLRNYIQDDRDKKYMSKQ